MTVDINGNIVPDNGLAASSVLLNSGTQQYVPGLYSGNVNQDFTFANNGVPAVKTDGIDYSSIRSRIVGINNNEGNTSWWQGFKDAFNPNGTSGRSYAGNVMDFAGTAAGIGTGLAGAYYTKKNFDLQKDNQDYLKSREAQADTRKATFAKNAGGGASY